MFHSIKSDYCKFSYYLYDCSNYENCFMCAWLKNKQYCILNKQYSKEKYKKEIENIFENLDEYLEEYENLITKTPKKLYYWYQNEDSTWDLLFKTKNCKNCFEITEGKDLKNYTRLTFAEDSMDITYFWFFMERCYMCVGSWDYASNLLYCYSCFNNVSNLIYSAYCVNCQDCFWCVWLRNKKYCILNKQYTKQEYEKLVPKIIEHMEKTGEWWEFFPVNISPFWYNQTLASNYYPLDKKEALNKWFNWSDYKKPIPDVEKIIPAGKLPENIKDIPDDILNWAIKCEVTWEPYRIIRQELDFYRKYNLPIPRKHPDQRYLERIQKKNPRKIFDRKCAKCEKEIQTSYSSESPEIIYCEECYNKEFY